MTALPDCWPDCLTAEQHVWAALLNVQLTDPVLIAWHNNPGEETYEEAVDRAIRERGQHATHILIHAEERIALTIIDPRSFLVGTINL